MGDRASDLRSGLGLRARAMAVGAVAALAAAAGGAAAAVPSDSRIALAHGDQNERQDTVAHKDEHLAQATVPAAAGSPASGSRPGFTTAELKALVPARIGAWRRRSLGPVLPGAFVVGGASVAAKFARAKQEATLTISDFAGPGLPAVPVPWSGAPQARETATGTEKTYGEGNRTVREELTRASGLMRVTLMLANGIVIGASGVGVDPAQLKKLVEGVDLGRAEAMARGTAPR